MKLSILFLLFFHTHVFAQNSEVFRIDSVPKQGILLDKGWKYQLGDNPNWAKLDFDDSTWDSIDPTKDIMELPQMSRNGQIGWLRLRLSLDSNINQPLALMIMQVGASEIYVNGKLIKSFGVISNSSEQIKAYNPTGKPICLQSNESLQQLAIRYALQPNTYYSHNFETHQVVGLKATLAKSEDAIEAFKQYSIFHTKGDSFRTGVYGVIFLLFFTMYLFLPNQKASLYFSIYALFQTIVWILFMQEKFSNEVSKWFLFQNIILALQVIDYLFMLTAVYSILEQRKSWFF